jgi:multiple sugar transport system ATP-binding protein
MLDRKPGQLSGGQPQRVAMGRAIVREPAAFLMDEPLSNLDAKLRVSMRSQLSRLHERLGVTTVYVTHDQVEAMTLGQRVAVMRGGVLQQCDTPEQLFDHPANLFVAAFIGSPAMNLVEAHGENGEARFGSCRVPSAFDGRFVLGIRPHDLKLGGPGIPARVQVVERLGTETHIVAGVDAPRLRAEALADAVDAVDADDDVLLAEDDRASFTVVTDARAPVAVGDRIELSVDPSRLHGFDAETGSALGTSSSRAPVAA